VFSFQFHTEVVPGIHMNFYIP